MTIDVSPQDRRTMQKMLNVGVPLMRAQGQKSKGGESGDSCLYRGPEGRKCMIGHLIADEFYSPELENMTVACDEVQTALIKSGYRIAGRNRSFWSQLQRDLHDRVDELSFRRSFDSALIQLCIDWNLKLPPQETAG